MEKQNKKGGNKNELTQEDINNDVKTFEQQPPMHPALEQQMEKTTEHYRQLIVIKLLTNLNSKPIN